jgi:hypothetical protein
MAMASNDKYFCYGREDGSVMIVDAYSVKRLRKVYSHGHGAAGDVLALSWSKSGRYMVSCDEIPVICPNHHLTPQSFDHTIIHLIVNSPSTIHQPPFHLPVAIIQSTTPIP